VPFARSRLSEHGLLPLGNVARIEYDAGAESDLLTILIDDGRRVKLPTQWLGSDAQDQLVLILRTHFTKISVVRG
jgi:hypothetical protein